MKTPPPPPQPPGPPARPSPPTPPAFSQERAARAEATFNSALERPSAERAAYLASACGEDGELRTRVDALLAAHERAGEFLPEDLPLPPEIEAELARLKPEEAGDIIGHYKLREQIGEGGFGTVWVAEQEKPVRRRVALKIIKLGMDTKEVIARFEQERQALAMMDHPNIAKVLDAGATQTGRPFFVMELVRGVKLTDYCDEKQLSTQERIELFVIVCQAVQHAHQKGIIHRDLKPSNVLVTVNDGKAVPKVIDFGVAKATQGRLTEQTVYTQFQQMIGTPLYMSPEQAELTSLDIDTRSDIYALGVMLYELLTGHTPIERDTLARAGLDEIRRLIREVDPPRPSARLKTLDGAELTTTAKRRHTDPAKLTGTLRGDLDWIVMKCLEKDRARRYDTATGLALDLQRYLANEVVIARPPTTAYLLGKLIRRNKGPVFAAALVLAALVAGIVGTTWGLIQARAQENKARAETHAKEGALLAEAERREGERKAKLEARAAGLEATKRLAQTERANALLFSIFESLDPAEIAKAERPLQAILVEKLDRTVAELESDTVGDPLVVAAMQNNFAIALAKLGELEKAVKLIEKARAIFQVQRGLDDPETLRITNSLATVYLLNNRADLALPLVEETLKRQTATLGAEHRDTLSTRHNLATLYVKAGKTEQAVSLFEETLRLTQAKFGPEDISTLNTMEGLADAYKMAGQRSKAQSSAEASFKIFQAKFGPKHPDTLRSMNSLATAYLTDQKPREALPLFTEAFRLRKATLGPNHPDTLESMRGLAKATFDTGQMDAALPLFEEVLKLQTAKLGRDHPDTLLTTSALAAAYQAKGRLGEALRLSEEVLRIQQSKLGPANYSTLIAMNNLGMAYVTAGKNEQALPLFEEAFRLTKAASGPEHPDTLNLMNNLALVNLKLKRPEVALPLFEEALKLDQAQFGPEHPRTLTVMANLAGVYNQLKRFDLARSLSEKTLALSRVKFGPEHPDTVKVMDSLIETYVNSGHLDLARPLADEALAISRKIYAEDSPQRSRQLAVIGLTLLEAHAFAEAEPILGEALELRERTQPEDWLTFNSKSLFGGALLGQKKYAEAEPLLRAGYDGMKLREQAVPPEGRIRISEALDRLIEWSAATKKTAELKKWQAERAKFKELK